MEQSPILLKEAAAKLISYFSINSEVVEPDNNCDVCTQINYSPAEKQQQVLGVTTENIILNKGWERHEIDLNRTDLMILRFHSAL